MVYNIHSIRSVRDVVANRKLQILSLETPSREAPDTHLADLIPDLDTPSPDEALEHRQLRERLLDAMDVHLGL